MNRVVPDIVVTDMTDDDGVDGAISDLKPGTIDGAALQTPKLSTGIGKGFGEGVGLAVNSDDVLGEREIDANVNAGCVNRIFCCLKPGVKNVGDGTKGNSFGKMGTGLAE